MMEKLGPQIPIGSGEGKSMADLLGKRVNDRKWILSAWNFWQSVTDMWLDIDEFTRRKEHA
jgi:hypothetical protein